VRDKTDILVSVLEKCPGTSSFRKQQRVIVLEACEGVSDRQCGCRMNHQGRASDATHSPLAAVARGGINPYVSNRCSRASRRADYGNRRGTRRQRKLHDLYGNDPRDHYVAIGRTIDQNVHQNGVASAHLSSRRI